MPDNQFCNETEIPNFANVNGLGSTGQNVHRFGVGSTVQNTNMPANTGLNPSAGLNTMGIPVPGGAGMNTMNTKDGPMTGIRGPNITRPNVTAAPNVTAGPRVTATPAVTSAPNYEEPEDQLQ